MRMEKGKLEVGKKSNLGRNEETARPGASLWSSLVREEKGKDGKQLPTVSTWGVGCSVGDRGGEHPWT